MAHIAPFRALRYAPNKATLSQVVTQPYDKITPEMRERYYDASPYNLARIILGKPYPTDHAGENVYTRAASFFSDWRREGAFLQDSQPSLYVYVERFTPPSGDKEIERRGFIALGKVEDYSAGIVFRHEQTLSKPKTDRLNLLRATRTHFEQIFMLYSDPAGEIEGVITSSSSPDMELRDEYNALHQVWKISDPGLISLVRAKMNDKKLIIADGHHRYETALNYRNERRAAETSAPSSETGPMPYELVMMTFVNMDSSGLVILPTHRVVHGLTSFSVEKFRQDAAAYFTVEEADASLDAAGAAKILQNAAYSGTALLAVTADRVFVLSQPKTQGLNIFAGLSPRQQSLDVVQLHKCLLEGVLGISEEAIRNQQNIRYIRDAGEALSLVRSGSANIAFLMNPARMEQVRDIAFAGEVMPQKSTDFYPKLLSGLTIYALE